MPLDGRSTAELVPIESRDYPGMRRSKHSASFVGVEKRVQRAEAETANVLRREIR